MKSFICYLFEIQIKKKLIYVTKYFTGDSYQSISYLYRIPVTTFFKGGISQGYTAIIIIEPNTELQTKGFLHVK